MSTQKHYRRCLEQLAADPPKRRVAFIRTLLPEIEAAVTSGQNLKDIWEALQTEGLGGELPHVLHGCMAHKKKTNRSQRLGETGQISRGARVAGKKSGGS